MLVRCDRTRVNATEVCAGGIDDRRRSEKSHERQSRGFGAVNAGNTIYEIAPTASEVGWVGGFAESGDHRAVWRRSGCGYRRGRLQFPDRQSGGWTTSDYVWWNGLGSGGGFG